MKKMKKMNVLSMIVMALMSISLNLSAAAKPDLVVTSIHRRYAQLSVNQYDTYKAYVRNQGTRTSPSTRMKFQVGGSVKYFTIPALAPGKFYWVSRSASFSRPGNFLITAVADVYNHVRETHERNNQKRILIRVFDYGKPDLFIRSLTPTGKAKVGQSVGFIVQVMNATGCGKSPATKVRIKIGGETYGREYYVPALAPGQGYNLGRYWTPGRAGFYRITAIADSNRNALEKNEGNNTKYITIRVYR